MGNRVATTRRKRRPASAPAGPLAAFLAAAAAVADDRAEPRVAAWLRSLARAGAGEETRGIGHSVRAEEVSAKQKKPRPRKGTGASA